MAGKGWAFAGILTIGMIGGCSVLSEQFEAERKEVHDYNVRHHGGWEPPAVPERFVPPPEPIHTAPTEDDGPEGGYNCLTMANKVCGPEWKKPRSDVMELFSEHEVCLWYPATKANKRYETWIVCSDGYITSEPRDS